MTSLMDVIRLQVLKPNFALIYTLGNTLKEKRGFQKVVCVCIYIYVYLYIHIHTHTPFSSLYIKPVQVQNRKLDFMAIELSCRMLFLGLSSAMGWPNINSNVFKMHVWSLQLQKWVLVLTLHWQMHYVYT